LSGFSRAAILHAQTEVGEDGAFELADDGRSEVILFGFALDEDVPSL
jgi:hypothetical protein